MRSQIALVRSNARVLARMLQREANSTNERHPLVLMPIGWWNLRNMRGRPEPATRSVMRTERPETCESYDADNPAQAYRCELANLADLSRTHGTCDRNQPVTQKRPPGMEEPMRFARRPPGYDRSFRVRHRRVDRSIRRLHRRLELPAALHEGREHRIDARVQWARALACGRLLLHRASVILAVSASW